MKIMDIFYNKYLFPSYGNKKVVYKGIIPEVAANRNLHFREIILQDFCVLIWKVLVCKVTIAG
jgi:hypothetical protein